MDNKLMAIKMKEAGLGNNLIAERLGISIVTVRRYVEKAIEVPAQKISTECCLSCGKPLEKTRVERHFCSRACRYKWWKENMLYSPSKAVRVFKCKRCGKIFITYGNKDRKYCCHSCYIKDRFDNEKRIV